MERCKGCGGVVTTVKSVESDPGLPGHRLNLIRRECACGKTIQIPDLQVQTERIRQAILAKRGNVTGSEVKSIRIGMGLPRAKFGQMLGLHPDTLKHLENDDIPLPEKYRQAFVEICYERRA